MDVKITDMMYDHTLTSPEMCNVSNELHMSTCHNVQLPTSISSHTPNVTDLRLPSSVSHKIYDVSLLRLPKSASQKPHKVSDMQLSTSMYPVMHNVSNLRNSPLMTQQGRHTLHRQPPTSMSLLTLNDSIQQPRTCSSSKMSVSHLQHPTLFFRETQDKFQLSTLTCCVSELPLPTWILPQTRDALYIRPLASHEKCSNMSETHVPTSTPKAMCNLTNLQLPTLISPETRSVSNIIHPASTSCEIHEVSDIQLPKSTLSQTQNTLEQRLLTLMSPQRPDSLDTQRASNIFETNNLSNLELPTLMSPNLSNLELPTLMSPDLNVSFLQCHALTSLQTEDVLDMRRPSSTSLEKFNVSKIQVPTPTAQKTCNASNLRLPTLMTLKAEHATNLQLPTSTSHETCNVSDLGLTTLTSSKSQDALGLRFPPLASKQTKHALDLRIPTLTSSETRHVTDLWHPKSTSYHSHYGYRSPDMVCMSNLQLPVSPSLESSRVSYLRLPMCAPPETCNESNLQLPTHATSPVKTIVSDTRLTPSTSAQTDNVSMHQPISTSSALHNDFNQQIPSSPHADTCNLSDMRLPPCQVCEEKATGFHYGVNTCDACKAFFRRSLIRREKYTCIGKGNCDITLAKRNFCTFCRHKKCLTVGMSKKAIKTGRYTYRKKTQDILEIERIKKGRLTVKVEDNSTPAFQGSFAQPSYNDEENEILLKQILEAHHKYTELTFSLSDEVPEKEQEECYGLHSTARLGPMTTFPRTQDNEIYPTTLFNTNSQCAMTWVSAATTEIKLQGYVAFVKAVPGFSMLSADDQANLIESARFEFFYLESFCAYNNKLKVITTSSGKCLHIKEVSKLWDEDLVLALFSFSDSLKALSLSVEELILIKTICVLFKDRCELQDPEKVEEIQWQIVKSLIHVLKKHHSTPMLRFSKIVDRLTSLRDLTEWYNRTSKNIYL